MTAKKAQDNEHAYVSMTRQAHLRRLKPIFSNRFLDNTDPSAQDVAYSRYRPDAALANMHRMQLARIQTGVLW